MKNFIHSLKILVVCSLVWCSCALQIANANPVGLDGIAAVVNDGAITTSQLADKMNFTIKQMRASHTPIPPQNVLKQKLLKQMIDEELQLQAAKKVGIKVDETAVDQAISRVAAQNGVTVGELQKQLQAQGIPYKQYRKEINNALIISQVQQRGLGARVSISDQEVTDFLNLHGRELAAQQRAAKTPAQPGFYHVQVIIIPLQEAATPEQIATGKQAAQKVFAQINENTNLQQFVATKLGTDLNLQQQDLGWRKLTDFPDLYIKLIQTLKPGGVSKPVQAPNGFHILRLAESRGGNSEASGSLTQAMVETHVRHILIKTNPLQPDDAVKIQLERLRANILAGTSFEEAATKNSQDPGSVAKGGDIGWVTPGALDPAFEAKMDQMKVGQISTPFKSQFGWHILQVLDRKTKHDPEEIRRSMAKQIIFQRKLNVELERWLQNQRDTGYVKELIQ